MARIIKLLRFQLTAVLLAALAVMFHGCPLGYEPADSDGVLVDGEAYEMTLEIREDGTMHATKALFEEDFEEAVINGEVDSVWPADGSFVVFGVLVVVIHPESSDDDEDELDDDELDDDELDDDELDDDEVGGFVLSEITKGMWIEARGHIRSDGIFHAHTVTSGTEGAPEILATIEDPTESDFTTLGLDVTYDSETEINTGECPTAGGN